VAIGVRGFTGIRALAPTADRATPVALFSAADDDAGAVRVIALVHFVDIASIGAALILLRAVAGHLVADVVVIRQVTAERSDAVCFIRDTVKRFDTAIDIVGLVAALGAALVIRIVAALGALTAVDVISRIATNGAPLVCLSSVAMDFDVAAVDIVERVATERTLGIGCCRVAGRLRSAAVEIVVRTATFRSRAARSSLRTERSSARTTAGSSTAGAATSATRNLRPTRWRS